MAHYRNDRRGFFQHLDDREERRFERMNEVRQMGGLEPRERTPNYYTNAEFPILYGGGGYTMQGGFYHMYQDTVIREIEQSLIRIGRDYQRQQTRNIAESSIDAMYGRLLTDFWGVDEPIELTNEEKVERKQAVGVKLEESTDFLFLLEKEEF